MTFEQYCRKVDEACQRLVGFSTYDLPDYDFWSDYEDNVRPETCARRVIKNAGTY